MDNHETKRFLLSRYNPMRSRKARVTVILVLAFFVIYSISGFFILPYFARKIGMEKLTAQLGRTVTINSVQFNPFTLDAVINNFEIKELTIGLLLFHLKNCMLTQG